VRSAAVPVRIGAPRPSPWLGGLDPADFDGSIARLVKASGAGTWGPHYLDLDALRVEQAHALGLRVVPWTVNETADMERLLESGVDGMITDRPDVLRTLLEKKGIAVPPRTADHS
jgi:glycerophosphoryl diester phosphodiesterase